MSGRGIIEVATPETRGRLTGGSSDPGGRAAVGLTWPAVPAGRRRLSGHWRPVACLLVLPIGFLAALYLYPLSQLLAQGLWENGLTLKYLRQVVEAPAYLRILYWTVRMAAITSVLCLAFGYPVAYLVASAGPRRRNLILALIILPFWTSSLVRAYAWIALLGRGGIVNTTLLASGVIEAPLSLVFNSVGLYVGTVHIMLPYMILSLYTVMHGIDRSLVRAAQTLGASPARAFVRVFLPLSLPGVAAGLLLVFVLTLGFFITPAILGGLRDETVVMLIEKLMNELMNWRRAAALATLLLLVTLCLYYLFARFFGFTAEAGLGAEARGSAIARAFDRMLDATDGALRPVRRSTWRAATIWPGSAGRGTERRSPKGPLRMLSLVSRGAVRASAWGVLVATIVPIAVIVLLAFNASYNLEFPPRGFSLQWFGKYFTRAEWVAATLTSFSVAVVVSLLATGLAVLVALALVRMPFQVQTLLFGVVLSPMIVPTMVYAVAVYFLFARVGLIGTRTGLALAHTVLALSPAAVVIFAALQNLDRTVDRAAASLGASPWRRFRHVTLPLIRPGVLAAALLAFLTSFDEVVVAIFLSGTGAVTLPKKMYESVRFDTDPTITAASAVLVGLTLIVLLLCEAVRRHGRTTATGRATTEGPDR